MDLINANENNKKLHLINKFLHKTKAKDSKLYQLVFKWDIM